MQKTIFIVALLGAMALAGCRGGVSEKPPIHLNPNMDDQERFEAQEANPFFADGRAMRQPVFGTVARGMLKEDTRFFKGQEADGSYVLDIPVPITREFVLRGRERYNIYCAVCHGKAGDGQGIVMAGGYGIMSIGYHNNRLRQIENGYLYDVIANGVRTMPAYGQQIPVADRWAITAYVRALQLSQDATADDIPPDILVGIQSGAVAAIAPAIPADPGAVPDGSVVFTTYMCNTCHSLDGSVGAGPSLQGIGSRQTREEITQSLREPDAVIVEGFFPGVMSASLTAFGFANVTDAEFEALVDFLTEQK